MNTFLAVLVFAYLAGVVTCCIRACIYKDYEQLREAARMVLLAPVNFIAWPLWIWRVSVLLGVAFETQWRLAFGRNEAATPKDSEQVEAEAEVERLLHGNSVCSHTESPETKEDAIKALFGCMGIPYVRTRNRQTLKPLLKTPLRR